MIAAFQAGERPVVIGTLSTMGGSVNRQRTNNVILLDRSFNPATNAQATDRAYRQGQKCSVTVTHIHRRQHGGRAERAALAPRAKGVPVRQAPLVLGTRTRG